jgi:hypothetical protein
MSSQTALLPTVESVEPPIYAYNRAKQLLRSQKYEVHNAVEAGDEVALELEWRGVLASPVMGLPAGTELKAHVGMFLTFRDGKITSQRNYDCYPPFGTQPDTAAES